MIFVFRAEQEVQFIGYIAGQTGKAISCWSLCYEKEHDCDRRSDFVIFQHGINNVLIMKADQIGGCTIWKIWRKPRNTEFPIR